MSRGKYSPSRKEWPTGYKYEYNYLGEKVTWDWSNGKPTDFEENHNLYFDDYDEEGYDSYGYSALDKDGKFVGHGTGVDRDGYTEMDYLTLQDIPEEHRNSYWYYNS